MPQKQNKPSQKCKQNTVVFFRKLSNWINFPPPPNGYFNAWSSVLLVSITEFAKLTPSSTRRKTRAGASAAGSPSWRALQSRGWDGKANEEQHPSPHQQKTCSRYPVRCENSGLASTAINSERLPAPRSPSGDWSVGTAMGVTDRSWTQAFRNTQNGVQSSCFTASELWM